MISPIFFAAAVALLTLGLLIEVTVFRSLHHDLPSTYRLFALRDQLVRLVIERKIVRDDPYFSALYRNVNILLRGCRRLSGPEGWKRAEADGKYLAHHPDSHMKLVEMPSGEPPGALASVLAELREALRYVLRNHYGIHVVFSERRREEARIQKECAEAMLRMMASPMAPAFDPGATAAVRR